MGMWEGCRVDGVAGEWALTLPTVEVYRLKARWFLPS